MLRFRPTEIFDTAETIGSQRNYLCIKCNRDVLFKSKRILLHCLAALCYAHTHAERKRERIAQKGRAGEDSSQHSKILKTITGVI